MFSGDINWKAGSTFVVKRVEGRYWANWKALMALLLAAPPPPALPVDKAAPRESQSHGRRGRWGGVGSALAWESVGPSFASQLIG